MAQSRAQKKFLAIKRAERRLQHRLDDIDYELDVLLPEVERIAELEKTQDVKIELESGDEAKADYDS